MSDEINSGLLIIGVSSTVLFDGETSTTELILLNLANGNDFALPISDEQAGVLYAHLEAFAAANVAAAEEVPGNGAAVELRTNTPEGLVASLAGDQISPEAAARAFANQIGAGGASDKTQKALPGETDPTPQF